MVGLTTDTFGPAAEIIGGASASKVLFVCEHASNHVPPGLDDLGLSADVLASHVAWDPGALDLAKQLAKTFSAPLVAGRISRLVYDCNRAPDAPDAMPQRSEIYDIPGNLGLTEGDRKTRIDAVYAPLHACVEQEIKARDSVALVTVHTFTPIYNGVRRSVEIGLLHGAAPELAKAMLAEASESAYDVQLNAPYGADDGVSHMVDRHGSANSLPNVMIEVRNDLAIDAIEREKIGTELVAWLESALVGLEVSIS